MVIVYVAIDVITIERTGENFRLIYDVKGRFAVHRITPEEAKVSHYVADAQKWNVWVPPFQVLKFNSSIFEDLDSRCT